MRFHNKGKYLLPIQGNDLSYLSVCREANLSKNGLAKEIP